MNKQMKRIGCGIDGSLLTLWRFAGRSYACI